MSAVCLSWFAREYPLSLSGYATEYSGYVTEYSGYATEYSGYATEYSGYATEYSQWVCHRILLASRADKMQVCMERVCLLKVGPYV